MGRIVAICERLAKWKGGSIGGADGAQLSDVLLDMIGLEKNCDPEHLLANCRDIGTDCSSFHFYHCDLGPSNILVNHGPIGIIDWETAGFVPQEWIITKFCISSGMDLPVQDENLQIEWRQRVSRQQRAKGFVAVADEWLVWRSTSR